MNPNSDNHPLLTFVLSRINPNTDAGLPPEISNDLIQKFPRLIEPSVISSLAHAIPTQITQTHFLLGTLGPRPDPETLSVAKSKITQINETGSSSSELEIYKSVLKLEEMHDDHERKLSEAEETLGRVYGTLVADLEDANAEVVRILKEAEAGGSTRVELSDRQLRFLPEDFGSFHGLVALNLSHNLLEVIPDSITQLEKLEELDVSSNHLRSLPESIGLLLNLKVLNVTTNKLNALPESIARCSSLVELHASFNNLVCLPTNIGYGLLNLERLSIQLNKLRSLPASVCHMRSLRCLEVHFNDLHGLPCAIGRLTNLEVLNLSSNFIDLKVLPETLGALMNLRELDMSNNQIQALPDTFFRLENLTKLNLNQNPLVIPPMEIVDKGVEAIQEYMANRWLHMLAEAEQQNILEANRQQQAQAGWLSWGSSVVTNFVFGVTRTVGGYIVGGKPSNDPYLDRQF